MGKIQDTVKVFRYIFSKGSRVIRRSWNSDFKLMGDCYPFADTIFFNICELLTDLCNDVTWTYGAGDKNLFDAFDKLYKTDAKRIMHDVKKYGYVPIIHTQVGEDKFAVHTLRIAKKNEVGSRTDENQDKVFFLKSPDPTMSLYIMRSTSMEVVGQSDYELLQPFREYLDNVLNASNTVSARMGTMVIASPKNLSSAPTSIILDKEEKDELEKDMQSEYGALSSQKQICLLPREMSFETINLAGLDQRTLEKAKLAILAIVDRFKVPANQVAIIDANSSKSFANGSELREGDFNKYQSFERFNYETFGMLAEDMGLTVSYTIDNKPLRQTNV